MQADSRQLFEENEAQRAAIIANARALSDAQFHWSPGADVWSVGQIVEHLVLSAELVGTPVEAAAAPNEAWILRLIPRAARRKMLVRAFNRDTVLPMPSPMLEPRGNVPLAELVARWNAVREATERDLASARELRYFHSILGPLTPAQMLTIGQAHTAYHMRQIDRLTSRAGFP